MLSIPFGSGFTSWIIEAFSVFFELSLWANAETVGEDLSVGASLNTEGAIPLGFIRALANQIQRVPDSVTITSDAGLSIPVGVGWADNTGSTIPVTGSANTVVQLIVPVSISTSAGSAFKTIPESVGWA